MTPDSALYYDPDYSEVYGWAEDIPLTERCKGCGVKCDSSLANGENFYCDPCWQHLECCTACGKRIFEGEVCVPFHNTKLNRIEFDSFHPNCLEEINAEVSYGN